MIPTRTPSRTLRSATSGAWECSGINPDETGLYTVSVTISDPEGHNYTFSQGIQSTWQTPNISNVAVGVPVFLQGDTFASPNWMEQSPSFWTWPNTAWTWSFVSCTNTASPPSTFTCPTLTNATTQYPSFVPSQAGTYVLTLTETSPYAYQGDAGPGWDAGPGPNGTYGSQTGTERVTVYAGNWLGIMNGSRDEQLCVGACRRRRRRRRGAGHVHTMGEHGARVGVAAKA